LAQPSFDASTIIPAAKAAGFTVEVAGANGKNRLRSIVGFHTFRHTCASLLFDQGRNVKQVAEWLGHADPSFTLRTYVHLIDDGVGAADFFDEAVATTGEGKDATPAQLVSSSS
jgi:integrase